MIAAGLLLAGLFYYFYAISNRDRYDWRDAWPKKAYAETDKEPYGTQVAHSLLADYFPEKKHLLKKLHNALVAEDFIKDNDDFEKSFEKETKSVNVQATLWLKDTPSLFYLLYRLNNKQDIFGKIRIHKIAFILFRYPKGKNEDNLRNAFNDVFHKFKDSEYLRKMSTIDSIIESLTS